MNDLVHLEVQRSVLPPKILHQKVLISASTRSIKYLQMLGHYRHLLRRLVRPPTQCPTRTLHYNDGAQSAEDACFIVLGRVQVGDNDIIGISELAIAGWACAKLAIACAIELAGVRAVDTEDMAVDRLAGSQAELRRNRETMEKALI